MRCFEVQELLVAAHDGELGPSAITVLEEHLAGCPRCRAWDERLRALHVGGSLRVPQEVQRALEAATDPRHLVPDEPKGRSTRWPLVIALAAGLLAIVGTTANLTREAPRSPTVVHAPIPASQWQPAAYQPAASDVPIYDTNVLHLPAPPSDEGPR